MVNTSSTNSAAYQIYHHRHHHHCNHCHHRHHHHHRHRHHVPRSTLPEFVWEDICFVRLQQYLFYQLIDDYVYVSYFDHLEFNDL